MRRAAPIGTCPGEANTTSHGSRSNDSTWRNQADALSSMPNSARARRAPRASSRTCRRGRPARPRCGAPASRWHRPRHRSREWSAPSRWRQARRRCRRAPSASGSADRTRQRPFTSATAARMGNPMRRRASAGVASDRPSDEARPAARPTSLTLVAGSCLPASMYRLSSRPVRTWPPIVMPSAFIGTAHVRCLPPANRRRTAAGAPASPGSRPMRRACRAIPGGD